MTHRDWPQQSGGGTDENVVSERGVALVRVLTGPAKSHIMKEDAVLPDDSRLTNYDTGSVIDKETGTNRSSRMDFKTGQEPTDLREQPGDEGYMQSVQDMNKPMYKYRVKPGIEQELNVLAGRIIAKRRFDVLNDG